ncbi:oxidoreductase [Paenibacillus baekrokdamisoli]|uniref:Oxidoreductase n=1 Tax=Paenibacillus baekrokdamisoli TaxID=1712516 RepID=A0A3G9JDW2_9BACL|nr:DoxX family protein [Paenibacillus baekrokdamisoli]MBB3070874.1 putative oxidoreductase [Paenibacillus baekrokdamisoli]BBH22188.1 oxidoreductase [Paenibacillus baekrokdamisoli]
MSIALGLLIIRLVFGLIFVGHGAQKLFGWFGGYGLKGTGSWLDSIGVKPGIAAAFVTGLFEVVGGLLFALGLWLPVAAALIVILMIGAIISVHGKNGFWITQNGIEYNVIIIAIAVGLALIGAGDYAIG